MCSGILFFRPKKEDIRRPYIRKIDKSQLLHSANGSFSIYIELNFKLTKVICVNSYISVSDINGDELEERSVGDAPKLRKTFAGFA